MKAHRKRLCVCGPLPFLFALMVSGCGFQLEGSGVLSSLVATTYLDTDKPYTEFYDSLRSALRARGAQVVDSRQNAGAVLRILADTTGQRVLSVSARNTPTEYEVFYAVTFSLESQGSNLIEIESLGFDAGDIIRREVTRVCHDWYGRSRNPARSTVP